ncbi:long-chain-fatty-acid--CoA ligase [Bacillus sp. FJAT-44742]|uniref:long-chain-fatty-acid--CoA ligase n=1 Tax=Bacillus sp. FJAT-44742 TaxID=2014005 RepID=UPI000C23F634|nr:long-chain fatty acid--CoA ligase [Bacillus sp. FJAT-44742]
MIDRPWYKHYPPGVEKEVSIPTASLSSLLKKAFKKRPTNTAVIDGPVRWSYQKLYEKVLSFSHSLFVKGFKPGDRALIKLFNSKEYIVAYFAVIRLGGTVVQANPLYTSEELRELINDSKASWAISHAEHADKIQRADRRNKLGVVLVSAAQSSGDTESFEAMIENGNPALAPEHDINPYEDVAVLQYTGGTTGKSKGVMLTHQNIFSNVYQNYHFTVKDISEEGEKLLGVSPFYHVYGMSAVMLLAVFRGSTIICISRFDPKKFLEIIRKERPTLFSGVPTVYAALLKQPEATEETMKSLKLCMAGSAPLPLEVIRAFEEKTGAVILEGYGLSETSPTTHRNPAQGVRKAGSIGIPVPNTDCKIVDQFTGEKEMPVGEVGELVIKGPQVMKGYWQREEDTKRTLVNGWLYTGDLARMDKDGYFYIVGRKKELIIASGYNVYPREIENVLYEHPSIQEAAVYGIPDEYRGETVQAAVVLKDQGFIDKEELRMWLKERLAVYKVPTKIDILPSLPKTSVGKILKRTLQNQAKENQLLK